MAAVFLSSSFTELREYRVAAFEAIDRLGHQCIRMENFPAADRQIPDFCREKIRGCELFVLILGKLYGNLIPGSDISFTEYEFDLGVELGLPIFVFTAQVGAEVKLEAALDRSGLSYKEHRTRLAAFQRKALTGRLGREFTDPSDLREKLSHSLYQHLKSVPVTQVERYPLPSRGSRTAPIETLGATTGPRIFISYRREDGMHVRLIRERIRTDDRLRRADVFWDMEVLKPGRKFRHEIQSNIESCDVMVVVIGRAWTSQIGNLGTPGDFIFYELECALKRGVPILPIAVDGARMPEASTLPPQLADLPEFSGITIHEEYYDEGVERLLDNLRNFGKTGSGADMGSTTS